MKFLCKFRYRVAIYAIIAVIIELLAYAMYMWTGSGFWFFVLENLNLILFPRIYTWETWVIWGMLGMFLFVTVIGEMVKAIAHALVHAK